MPARGAEDLEDELASDSAALNLGPRKRDVLSLLAKRPVWKYAGIFNLYSGLKLTSNYAESCVDTTKEIDRKQTMHPVQESMIFKPAQH